MKTMTVNKVEKVREFIFTEEEAEAIFHLIGFSSHGYRIKSMERLGEENAKKMGRQQRAIYRQLSGVFPNPLD